MRDRRWDHLHEREKQPVRDWLLDTFAAEVAEELRAWPPALDRWVGPELLARWGPPPGTPPREDLVRFALDLARHELVREFDVVEARLASEGARRWQGPEETALGHLLVRYLTERCLDLMERAEGARLARADLVHALGLVERRRFPGAAT